MTACERWIRPVLLGTVVATTAASCALESGTTDSASLFARPADLELGGVEALLPDLELLDLPRNGLTSEAITRATLTASGTQSIFRSITNGALTESATLSYADKLWLGSNDPTAARARALMKYIVSCALDPDEQGLPGVVRYDDVPLTWSGGLGLCDGRAGTPGDWTAGAPSEGCLQAVSACVLARVNAQQKRVIVSMRGESTALLPLRPRVKVETQYRENEGTPIHSFSACPAISGNDGNPMRDCSWEARYVGTCIPNSEVTLQVNSHTSAMVRICKGIYGCDHADTPPPLGGIGYYTPWYAGVIKSSPPPEGGLTFTCPGAAVPTVARSYFSVMLASSAPDTSLPLDVDVTLTSPISNEFEYPAPESKVFTYREGAFYGNLFAAVPATRSRLLPELLTSSRESGFLHPNNLVTLPAPSPSPSDLLINFQYACYSKAWSSDLARLSDRLCAGPTSPCFEHVPQPCQPRCLAQVNETVTYQQCNEVDPEPRRWDHAITVYLNHPCDLARDVRACMTSLGAKTP